MIEYKIISLPKTEKDIDTTLNDWARQGWRVVCSCGKAHRHLILKRKVREKVREEDDY